MRTSTPHLDFYQQHIVTGLMPYTGLCHAADEGAISEELLQQFKPTQQDVEQLIAEGAIPAFDYDYLGTFWAYGGSTHDGSFQRCFAFTTLRQTVILFMAAINNEL